MVFQLREFNLTHTAVETARDISTAFGEKTASERNTRISLESSG